jgi:hypothetical protein
MVLSQRRYLYTLIGSVYSLEKMEKNNTPPYDLVSKLSR